MLETILFSVLSAISGAILHHLGWFVVITQILNFLIPKFGPAPVPANGGSHPVIDTLVAALKHPFANLEQKLGLVRAILGSTPATPPAPVAPAASLADPKQG